MRPETGQDSPKEAEKSQQSSRMSPRGRTRGGRSPGRAQRGAQSNPIAHFCSSPLILGEKPLPGVGLLPQEMRRHVRHCHSQASCAVEGGLVIPSYSRELYIPRMARKFQVITGQSIMWIYICTLLFYSASQESSEAFHSLISRKCSEIFF